MIRISKEDLIDNEYKFLDNDEILQRLKGILNNDDQIVIYDNCVMVFEYDRIVPGTFKEAKSKAVHYLYL